MLLTVRKMQEMWRCANVQICPIKHTVYWLWEWVERPLLVRPVWLLPAAFGLICGGAALTLNSRPPSRSHRRRS